MQVDQVLFRVSGDILRLCSDIKQPISNPLNMSGITAGRFGLFLSAAAVK